MVKKNVQTIILNKLRNLRLNILYVHNFGQTYMYVGKTQLVQRSTIVISAL